MMNFEQSISKAIEDAVKKETVVIMEKYKGLMEADLEEAKTRIVSNMALRISEQMSISQDGRVVRIEIVKRGDL